MERGRTGLRVIDGRLSAKARRDEARMEKLAFIDEVEQTARKQILRCQTARLELLRLGEPNNAA